MQGCCMQPMLREATPLHKATLLESWQRLSQAGCTSLCSRCRSQPWRCLTWPTASVFSKAPLAPSQLSSCALSSEEGSFRGCLLRAIITSTSRKASGFFPHFKLSYMYPAGNPLRWNKQLGPSASSKFQAKHIILSKPEKGVEGLVSVVFSISSSWSIVKFLISWLKKSYSRNFLFIFRLSFPTDFSAEYSDCNAPGGCLLAFKIASRVIVLYWQFW